MALRTITGTIKDAADAGLSGSLVFLLNKRTKEGTSVHLPTPHVFSVVNGALSGVQLHDNASMTPTDSYYDCSFRLSDGSSISLGKAVVPALASSNLWDILQ